MRWQREGFSETKAKAEQARHSPQTTRGAVAPHRIPRTHLKSLCWRPTDLVPAWPQCPRPRLKDPLGGQNEVALI